MSRAPLAAFAVAGPGIAVFSSMDAVVRGLSLATGTYDTPLGAALPGAGCLVAARVGARPAPGALPA